MKTIRVSVRNLVEFMMRSGDIDERRGQGGSVEAMLEGARIHRAIQAAAGSDYSAEVPLKTEITLTDELTLILEGRADGIIEKKGYFTIDEIKGMYLNVKKLKEPVPVHLAQAKCYAFIWASLNSLSDISVRMTYVGIEDRHIKLFNLDYEYEELKEWFEALIESYRPWAQFMAEWMDVRRDSIRGLEFPYEYRKGQKELASDVYKTIYHKKKLFLEAPTGTGKTLSVLYPAVKAVGEGLASYVFYLTAKNIGAKAASDTVQLMRDKGGLRLKTVNITGRDRVCLNSVPHCNPVECDFARGHFDRVNEVLYELLTSKDIFSRENIEEAALKGRVCPYALARDLTEFSDCIICDYNYVFDPGVALRHFFGEGKKQGEYIFLVDEAHNMVDRARDMYSALMSLRVLSRMKLLVRGMDRKLTSGLNALIGQMELLREEYESTGAKYILLTEISGVANAASRVAGRIAELLQERRLKRYDDPEDGTNGVEDKLKAKEAALESKTSAEASVPLTENNEDSKRGFSDEFLQFYFDLLRFIDICDRIDARYRIYVEKTETGDIRLKLLCVDPSRNLSEYLSYGRASVFFSATLLPVTYYMDLLAGGRDVYSVYASSVFDPEKLGVFVDTAVTSRYAKRGVEEYRKIAEHIRGITQCRKGNYMVFFPSYSFMENVASQYEILEEKGESDALDTGRRIVLQTAEMSDKEREDFLRNFSEERDITGFCVLGGLFAEGIDLTGEKLIGAIIVGTGLPQISNEKDILKNYFNENDRDGFDYAMKIPGMNKVLQAAGRVIRTEEDTGVIALLDERFDKPDHKRMYPREWRNIRKITGCEYNLVSEFWNRTLNK